MKHLSAKSAAAACLVLLLVNTSYVAAFASPTIFYMANVLAHVALGLVFAILGFFVLARHHELRRALNVPAALYAIALAIGIYLTVHGNLSDDRWMLRSHVAAGILAIAALAPFAWKAFGAGGPARVWASGVAAASVLAIALPFGVALYARTHPPRWSRIANPATAPTSMAEEGGGPGSPFFPSAAKIGRASCRERA